QTCALPISQLEYQIDLIRLAEFSHFPDALLLVLQLLQYCIPDIGVLSAILPYVHTGKMESKNFDLRNEAVQQVEEQSVVMVDKELTGRLQIFYQRSGRLI